MQALTRNMFPFFNIKNIDENNYSIELAVAGYGKNQLDVNFEGPVLTITGTASNEDGAVYFHRGVSNRDFVKKFNIGPLTMVHGAELANGMLKIYLEKLAGVKTKVEIEEKE